MSEREPIVSFADTNVRYWVFSANNNQLDRGVIALNKLQHLIAGSFTKYNEPVRIHTEYKDTNIYVLLNGDVFLYHEGKKYHLQYKQRGNWDILPFWFSGQVGKVAIYCEAFLFSVGHEKKKPKIEKHFFKEFPFTTRQARQAKLGYKKLAV